MITTYSIKELEHLSGVKAHTLRIWEQRYAILKPNRTNTNIRYYTADDLKLVLNIALLNQQGHRIGSIAKMSKGEITAKVATLGSSEFRFEWQINQLAHATIEVDEASFEKTMATCILQHGLEKTMLKIIYPFLEKIGIMWMTGNINPAQEHFISNLIRQKIIVAIDGQVVTHQAHSKHYLLFLPEGELHELSLLFLCYLLKSRDNYVTYLGASVPIKDVKSVVTYKNPDFLYTISTTVPTTSQLKKYLNELANTFPNKTILFSGQRSRGVRYKLPSNIVILKKLDDVFSFIKRHATAKI